MTHLEAVGKSDEWYTPPEIFDALNLLFDLDPCSPGIDHWVPAKNVYTKEHNGLIQPWHGLVFMNPPFGGRGSQIPWLKKFLLHANGIAIFNALTSSGWFQEYAVRADSMLFPRGKTKFIRPDGSIGKQPGNGVVLLGMGDVACEALKYSQLGFFIDNRVSLSPRINEKLN